MRFAGLVWLAGTGLAVMAAVAAGDFTVEPLGETAPFGDSESADDAAVWVHPTDPALSLIVGNNKDVGDPAWGVHVYNLDGTLHDSVIGAKQNNVDVRYGFMLGGSRVDLVASTNRTDETIDFFTIDPLARTLTPTGSIASGFDDPYGLALWHDRSRDAFHVFISDNDGNGSMRHYELFDDNGSVGGHLRREWNVGSLTEGLVVDDGRGHLFVGEENIGVWRYDAHADAPTGPGDRVAVGQGGGEVEAGDVEGLAVLYVGKARGEQGYLLVSEQGNDSFAILERVDHDGDGDAYEYIDRFEIVSGNGIDGTSDTDGIEAVSTGLNATFSGGLFIAQDGSNDTGGQNYKLVSWADVAAGAAGGLATDPAFDPRWDGRADLVWTPAEGDAWNVDAAANWAAAGSPRTFWQGDDVLFDDTGGGGMVTVAETVEPNSFLVDSDAVDYTLTGPGGIAGLCGLTKRGSGTLTVATDNAYAGGTLVAAGTVAVAADGALGSGTVLLGDTMDPADAALLVDGPFTVANAVTVQDDGEPASARTLGGINTSGTAVFSGDLAVGKDLLLTAEAGGEVRLGGALNNADGHTLVKVGAGTLVLEGLQDHGAGSLLDVRDGLLFLNSDASGTGLMDDADLSILVADATLHFGCNQHLDTLDIRDGGLVQLTGANVVVVKHLVMDGTDLGATTLTPEPAALLLLSAGCVALAARRKLAGLP
jgi:3-phytase